MKPVHVCVPTLRRYDLLQRLVLSLNDSKVPVTRLYVIDNGKDQQRLASALASAKMPVDIFVPEIRMGVAESWNWFIANVEEERLIVNDDLVFDPSSIGVIAAAPGHFVTATAGMAFSCFLIRDVCIEQVGFFDEDISPGYAYFEDCDYEQRMFDKQIYITHVEAGVVHDGSATLPKQSPEAMNEHHRRFKLARQNFMTKWGQLPRGMEPVDVATNTADMISTGDVK